MATSHYFNNYDAKYNEQRLVEDLITESIKIMGFDAEYLPNTNDEARDLLYGEDPVKKFQSAFAVEMYLSNALDYNGQKDFFSKFGLEMRDQVSVILSRRAFEERIPKSAIDNFVRPREGDLVYVPFLNGTGELYEIKFVEQAKDFHMLGRRESYFYELQMEKFKYSNELIDTGIAEIDITMDDSAYTQHLNMGVGTGTYVANEIVVSGSITAIVQSWVPSTKILSVMNIKGSFANNSVIVGQTSGASYTLTSYDPLNNPAAKEVYDNKVLDTEGISIIDFSEQNPFGTL
jgi:hypothetical protein